MRLDATIPALVQEIGQPSLQTGTMNFTGINQTAGCLTYTCPERSVSTAVYVLLYVCAAAAVLLTVCGNLLIIISVCHFKQLHTPTNMLVLSLAVSDLLVGALVLPTVLIRNIESCWVFKRVYCICFQLSSYFLTSTSIYTIVLIAVDRYFALSNPFLYTKAVSVSAMCAVVLCDWFVLLSYNIALQYVSLPFVDLIACAGDCFLLLDEVWSLVDLLFTFVLPFSVIIILYGLIFIIAKRHATAIRDLTAQTRTSRNAADVKSERKAARVVTVLVSVFLVCLLPYFTYAVLGSVVEVEFESIQPAVILLYLNSAINPVIYALFYPWFRRSGCCVCRQSSIRSRYTPRLGADSLASQFTQVPGLCHSTGKEKSGSIRWELPHHTVTSLCTRYERAGTLPEYHKAEAQELLAAGGQLDPVITASLARQTGTMNFTGINQTDGCLTYTCPERSVSALYVLMYVCAAAAVLLTVCGNLLVIVSVCHFKRLHTPTNMLLLSLAASDLLVGALVLPIALIWLIESCWVFKRVYCIWFQLCAYFLTSTSIYTIVLIAVDRYFALSNPFLYSKAVSVSGMCAVVSCDWVVLLLYNVALLYFNLPFVDVIACPGDCFLLLDHLWSLADLLLTFVLPFSAIIILHTLIFIIAKRHATAIRDLTAQTRTSRNAADVKLERKAARVVTVLVSVFLVCLLPYFIYTVLGNVVQIEFELIEPIVILLYLNSAINPVIYALFYPWFRRTKPAKGISGVHMPLHTSTACIAAFSNWFILLVYNIIVQYFGGHLASVVLCPGDCFLVLDEVWSLVDLLFIFILPCAVIIILYTLVFVIARRHAAAIRDLNAQTQKLPDSMKSERKAAKVLGILVSVFLACLFPYFVYTLLGNVTEIEVDSFQKLLILVYLNSTINPVIYALCYPWFRKAGGLC
ncbi:hypothetical protein NFI96_006414 [Prochilodus magdalenae]|nr:hypothetical protein NFI96_006414 [Prochilodus magdalenae]